MKSFSNETLNRFVQKVLFFLQFGSCQNCMSSTNIVAENHQNLCNIKFLSNREPCTCEYVTLLQILAEFWQDPKCRRNRTSVQKNLVFHWRKISYFAFIYIFPLVLLLISSLQIHDLELARGYLLTLKTLAQMRHYRICSQNLTLLQPSQRIC